MKLWLLFLVVVKSDQVQIIKLSKITVIDYEFKLFMIFIFFQTKSVEILRNTEYLVRTLYYNVPTTKLYDI